MNKPAKRVLAALLSVMTASSMVTFATTSASAAETTSSQSSSTSNATNDFKKVTDNVKNAPGKMGDTGMSAEEIAKAPKIKSVKDYYNADDDAASSTKKAKKEIATNSATASSVDNSQSKYFPPIGDQNPLGSCTCWANIYYQLSYEENRQLDRTATYENSLSPTWVYPYVNNGGDNGSSANTVMDVAKEIGVPTIKTAPVTQDYMKWNTDANAFKEAQQYRLSDYYIFYTGAGDTPVTSPDDSDIAAVKTALQNGKVLTFSTYFSGLNYEQIQSNSTHQGEYIATYAFGLGGPHRMTLVGYDDNIWVDINHDGKVQEGEKGAFKVANSWGVNYSAINNYYKDNDGFIWFSYDILNTVSSVDNAYLQHYRYNIGVDFLMGAITMINVAPTDSSSGINLEYTLNTELRGNTAVYVIATDGDKVYKSAIMPFSTGSAGAVSFDGTENASSASFIYDLSNIVPNLNSKTFNNYNWYVEFADKAPYYSGDKDATLKVSNVKVTDSNNGRTYKTNNFKKDITVDNTQVVTTINNDYENNENAPLDILEFSSYNDSNEISQYDSVTVGTWAIGGTAPYQYKYSYIVNGKETVLQDFSAANTLTHQFKEAGNYTLKVVVKDDDGNTKTDTMSLKVKKTTINDIKIVESTETDGTKYLTVIPEIENTPSTFNAYNVRYTATLNGKESNISWNTTKDYHPIGIWTPDAYGTYTVNVAVRDYDTSETIVEKSVQYTVTKDNNPLSEPYATIETFDNYDFYKNHEIGVGNTLSFGNFRAYGGQAPYTFRAGYVLNGKTTYVNDYTTDTSSVRSNPINELGKIKPFVIVKDANGDTSTRYFDECTVLGGFKFTDMYCYNEGGSIGNDTYKAGYETYINAGYTRGVKNDNSEFKSCVYTIKKDGYKFAEISQKDSSKLVTFTPSEAGTYEITVTATDQLNQTATYTKVFNFVKSDNLATIYYKGYETPYIHYKVDNKSWSQVPGYKMPATDAYQDYTNTFTIDLGNASGAEICFNDGKNNWDSRNGANYRLCKGKYTYSNGKLEKIDDSVLRINKFKVNEGKSEYTTAGNIRSHSGVPFVVDAKGGTGEYTYRYGYIKDGQKFFLTSKFIEQSYQYFYMTMGGTVTPFVIVKDSSGATVEQYAQSIKLNTMTVSMKIVNSAPYKVNQPITFDASAENAVTNLSYTIYYLYTISKDSEYIGSAASYDGTATWIPEEAGRYTVNVLVEDALGQLKNATMTFDVVDKSAPLTIDSFNTTPDKTYAGMFENYRMSANASGGTAPYQYQFSYTRYGETKIISDFSSNNSASLICPEMGPYQLNVTVKDAEGNTVTKSKDITIGQTYLLGLNTNKDTAKTGETIKISPDIHNEASTITSSDYTYTVTKDNKTQTLSTLSDKTANWTPTEAGTYTLSLTVKHSGVLLAIYTKEYTVEKNTNANEITIYYKGYDTPYIHYQVGNGSWTNAPGYAMTKTSEMNGYTHKYTINLGNATYANVCFNNGNGNWDSNGGRNYRFEKGTFTFSNGKITAVDDGALRITSFDITPADGKIKVGDSVSMHVNVANGDGTTMCAFYYKKNNGPEIPIYDYSYGFSCSKQFVEAGTYTLIAKVKNYGSNDVVTAEKTVVVSDNNTQQNTVTIYYKGYSTPYIHYQVGNGSWTNAPGFAMTATNEKNGYTHKYTIDLGNSSYANVCFNNGNGSWDSRNGQNYRFEKGTYTYSNGNLTKIS